MLHVFSLLRKHLVKSSCTIQITDVAITGSDFYEAHSKDADGVSVLTRETQADLLCFSLSC